MAKVSGRACVIKKNNVAIAGLLTNSITVNGSPVNVEDKTDAGFQTMLAGVLTGQSIEISGEGWQDGEVLRDIGMSATQSDKFLTDITYYFANGDVISGDFVLGPYSENAERDEAEKFTATFVSDGAWTYTAAI